LTFSGTNGGWDYTGTLNYSQNKNDNRNLAGYPVEFAVAGYPNQPTLTQPNGLLSNLINPFGPQSAAGQALITSSYLKRHLLGRRGQTVERRRPCQPRAGRCF